MSKRVLIVDDFASVRKLIDSVLSKQGFVTMHAEDGERAQEILRDTRVDLVVSDINMPRMDGVALLEYTRRASVNRNVPFLLVTTEEDADLSQRAEAANVSGWVAKPFKIDQFLVAVNSAMGNLEAARAGA